MTMAIQHVEQSTYSEDLPLPLFELKGPLAKVDLSAWLSGLCLAGGLAAIGPTTVLADRFGLLVLGLAYVWFLVCVLLIQRHMRIALSAHTFGAPQELVSRGIFRFSRNPIYVAFLLPLLALAYHAPVVSGMVIALYVMAMNLTVIRKEERDLHRIFGTAFITYRNTVPRWLVL